MFCTITVDAAFCPHSHAAGWATWIACSGQRINDARHWCNRWCDEQAREQMDHARQTLREIA